MIKSVQFWCLILFVLPFVLAQEDSHDHEHDHEHDSLEFHTSDFDEHDHDDHEEDAGLAMAITIAAGFAAFLGAFSMFCIKREQLGVIPVTLGFSSGVVVYLSFVNLIPECIELLSHSGDYETEALPHFYGLLCVIGGIVIAYGSDQCFSHHHHDDETGMAGHADECDKTSSDKP